jgi:hypothetical protein
MSSQKRHSSGAMVKILILLNFPLLNASMLIKWINSVDISEDSTILSSLKHQNNNKLRRKNKPRNRLKKK